MTPICAEHAGIKRKPLKARKDFGQMRNNRKDLEKKIAKMMAGNYEPSLADSIRIYKEYRINKGELAGILSDIYSWLAQKPICVDYKHGKLYMRCEMIGSEELFAIHYIYINAEKNIALENFFSQEDRDITDSSIKELVPLAKEMVCCELDNLQELS